MTDLIRSRIIQGTWEDALVFGDALRAVLDATEMYGGDPAVCVLSPAMIRSVIAEHLGVES